MNTEYVWWFLILVAVGIGVVGYIALGPVPEIETAPGPMPDNGAAAGRDADPGDADREGAAAGRDADPGDADREGAAAGRDADGSE
jgi:hypothetical protein